jgi:hypothetical protein
VLTQNAKTDKRTIADLIFAAGVPPEDAGVVYLKLASRALPEDEHQAKAYIRRTLQRARIDEERRHLHDRLTYWDPLSARWDVLVANQFPADDGELKWTLHVLVQMGITLLPPHQRSLVRAWMARSGENNVVDIHEALPKSCGQGAYHCKNKAFTHLTRIVAGLATAMGWDLRLGSASERSRRERELRARQRGTAILKKPGGARLMNEGNA